MELVVSMDGRGTRSSMPLLDVQAARQNNSDARTVEERIPTLYAEPKQTGGHSAGSETRIVYGL